MKLTNLKTCVFAAAMALGVSLPMGASAAEPWRTHKDSAVVKSGNVEFSIQCTYDEHRPGGNFSIAFIDPYIREMYKKVRLHFFIEPGYSEQKRRHSILMDLNADSLGYYQTVLRLNDSTITPLLHELMHGSYMVLAPEPPEHSLEMPFYSITLKGSHAAIQRVLDRCLPVGKNPYHGHDHRKIQHKTRH